MSTKPAAIVGDVEVLTMPKPGRRRTYTLDEKRRTVEESHVAGVSAVARRYGISRPGYTAADTVAFGRSLGFLVCTTPPYSPESNGMAEAFVKTFKRDYVSINPIPDAVTVLAQLGPWFEDYNQVHPHKGLKMRSPREFLSAMRFH